MKNVLDIRADINFNVVVAVNGYDVFGMCESSVKTSIGKHIRVAMKQKSVSDVYTK